MFFKKRLLKMDITSTSPEKKRIRNVRTSFSKIHNPIEVQLGKLKHIRGFKVIWKIILSNLEE